ncbi:major facilitator superfamily transporter [Ceratobasidium sp. AG-Ba]|nr:major facilitator superfamily transporter [Ceratobasidium sp. AG-Ba]
MIDPNVLPYSNTESSQPAEKPTNKELNQDDSCSDAKSIADPTDGAPWRWRIIAWLFALSLAVGSSFSESTLGPLKSTLIKQLKINNARYGTIASATSVVNMFLPIVGGYFVDFYPLEYSMLFCAFTVFAGAIVSAAGAQHQLFGPVLGGRLLMGFGSTIIEIIPQKIYWHWFRGRGLAFVLGLDVSWGKVIVLVAKATAVPMSQVGDTWSWALWIPAIVCGVNVLLTFGYIMWVRTLPEHVKMLSAQERDVSKRRRPTFKAAKEIPSFFWFIFCTQICQAGVVGSFNGLSADIIRQTRGTTAQIAGYQGAIQQVIPIFFTPFLGAFFDRYGRRMLFISITSCIWITVFGLLGFSTVHALLPMVFSSVALSFNAMPFVCSVPLLVASQDQIGTGYGLYKAFNNAGSVIVDVAAGAIQDSTSGGGYNGVIAFFIALKALEVLWGSVYGILDRRLLRGVLTMSERKRHEIEKSIDLNEEIGRQPRRAWTYGGWAFLGSAIIIALVLFIKYSI